MDKRNAIKLAISLKNRHRSENRFKIASHLAILFSISFLFIMIVSIVLKGYSAFFSTKIAMEIDVNSVLNSGSKPDYRFAIKNALNEKFAKDLAKCNCGFSDAYQLLSKNAAVELYRQIKKNPSLGQGRSIFWLSASAKVDAFFKHRDASKLNKQQIQWLLQFMQENKVKTFFNYQFLLGGDSRESEIAGIAGSFIGSIMTIIIFLIFSFPIAVASAFYLEEFALKNRFTDFIEISINNLAAIPSIIYGLLGLVVYLQILHLPRASTLVAGFTLSMLVLPVIIIATRNTIRSIPNSIRDGAIGLGASKTQLIIHHLLPLSTPGIMTGTILAISRALGETAPLLMIGMIAFIVDFPQNFLEPATVMPVQIYLWSDSAETGFVEKTSAVIMLLIGLLIMLNLTAIILRKKFEKKW